MEVRPADFARMCQVSKASVSVRIKNGSLILNSGKKIDTDNPINRAYLEKKQAAFKSSMELKQMEDSATYKSKRNTASAMLNMTVGQLVRTYGNIDAVANYSKILRDLTFADEKEQRLQERRLKQIPKDFVEQRLFGYVDTLMNMLLDVPEGVCDQILAMVKSKGEDCRNDVVHIISDSITRCVAGAKEHIISELRTLRGKYEKQDAMIDNLISEKLEEMKEA